MKINLQQGEQRMVRRLHPSGHKLAEVILDDHGHVGLTVNPIILQDIFLQVYETLNCECVRV